MRLLLPLGDGHDMAHALARRGAGEVGDLETRRFPDGEHHVRLVSDPAGRDVAFICSLARVDDWFLSLAFAADAARELGATRVGLVAPYLGYMRQDIRFVSGEAVTSRTFARLVSRLFDFLVTVDPHLHRVHSLSEIYTIPTATLHAAPLLGAWIRDHVERALVIGPDAESEQWAREVAAVARAPVVVLRKERLGDREVRISFPDLSIYQGRTPVLIDDIAASGRTLAAAAQALMALGFAKPVCAVVHPVFGGDAFEVVSEVSQRVVSTDSLAHASNAIPLAPLLAEALRKEAIDV